MGIETLHNMANYIEEVLDQCRKIILKPIGRVWEKNTAGHKEIVSNLDVEIENFIKNAVRNKYPKATFIAEESVSDGFTLSDSLCFVIDPIDGTKEFVAGRSGFSISVAIIENKVPLIGIVDFPKRDQRFIAIRGNGLKLKGKKGNVNKKTPHERLRVAVSPSQFRSPEFRIIFNTIMQALPHVDFVPIGALTPKIAAVISQEVDAAIYLKEKGKIAAIWDYLAIGIALEEAGGQIIDFAGQSLLVRLETLYGDGWIAFKEARSEIKHLRAILWKHNPTPRSADAALPRANVGGNSA